MTYADFLARKRRQHLPRGFEPSALSKYLKDFQRHIVEWAVRRGRAAIFADCGLGKTLMQLEWARQVHERTQRPVLILAPLAVASQTQREGAKFGIPVSVSRDGALVGGITVTNYEMLHKFDCRGIGGVVLDESSILKSFTGSTRNQLIETFSATEHRLACTATPSPNDYMELGNHSEFLGVMDVAGMLATFFNHNGGETSKWRLKGHAERPFWNWLASWAMMISRPSDLGFSDEGYNLPVIERKLHIIETPAQDGVLFPVEAASLGERRESRRISVDSRAERLAELIGGDAKQWLLWGDLNAETDAMEKSVARAVQVAGSDSPEWKEECFLGFADGKIERLVTKPKIGGFGMNWQNCSRMAFFGLSDSYESTYQAERRCWRFGQRETVQVHTFITDRDAAVVRNIERKRKQAEEMAAAVVAAMKEASHG